MIRKLNHPLKILPMPLATHVCVASEGELRTWGGESTVKKEVLAHTENKNKKTIPQNELEGV